MLLIEVLVWSSTSAHAQKFWVLETVARIPYFAYISILHLYESLGFWRAGAELRKIHFAEEWNGELLRPCPTLRCVALRTFVTDGCRHVSG